MLPLTQPPFNRGSPSRSAKIGRPMRLHQPSNFRPVGPLAAPLWRSDHLGALNDDDARQIRALGITRVLDFRGVDERSTAMCALPEVNVVSLPIEPTIVQKLHELIAAGHQLTAADAALHMQDTYRGFVRRNTPRFADFFAHLLDSDEPTVFHCTAGKDRTGFAAALLLRAVGVREDEVMQDYLLTNERLRLPDTAGRVLPAEVLRVLWGVQPGFLEAAFDEARAAYGSLEAYLREGLRLGEAERSALRAAYAARRAGG
jgi:protein-tyrosine phosphatase